MPSRDSAAPIEDLVRQSLERAPLDEEPVTEEDIRAIREAREDPVTYSHEEVRGMLGLDDE